MCSPSVLGHGVLVLIVYKNEMLLRCGPILMTIDVY